MSDPPEARGDADLEPRGRLEEVLVSRREALKRLRDKGIEPFALRFDKDADAADLHDRFQSLAPGEESGQRAGVAGRVMLLRRHGKAAFATLRDRTGDIQLYLTQDGLGDGYELVDLLDLGDIVGATGQVVRTRRGELSVKAGELVLLTKALRPLPEKWHGLRDAEARFRQRYLEFATNPESRRLVRARAQVLG